MRRKPDTLLPLEMSILGTVLDLFRGGQHEFHGFFIAREIQQRESARLLTAYGTLYKALARLEHGGLLDSRWEDPQIAAAERRPQRRLYHLTAQGVHVAEGLPVPRHPSPAKLGERPVPA